MSINDFSQSPQRDGTPVTSVINAANLLYLINNDTTNPYFDDISKIERVDVFYKDSSGREQKDIIHYPNLTGTISFSQYALDGTWQKEKVRCRDTDGAILWILRDQIGFGEDLFLT